MMKNHKIARIQKMKNKSAINAPVIWEMIKGKIMKMSASNRVVINERFITEECSYALRLKAM
jgi:hypothetical protein